MMSMIFTDGEVIRKMNFNYFRNPPKEFRPSPFWSWNDKLNDEELTWQINEMKDKGFGGYFMHSRGGVETRYLGKEWMKRVRTCLEAGKRIGIASWLYDEDKWPSGFAGGFVTKRNRRFRAKGISLEIGRAHV